MSMLRYFLDIEGAEEHRRLFDGLAVSQDAATMQLQGSRPVLFLTLKGWKANNWQEMQEVIVDGLGQMFDEREYLLDTPTLTKRERRTFEAIQMGTASIITCRSALVLLLRLLARHYGKKPVLLLDEYDVPIQTAWTHHYYDEAIGFFREFLSGALKSNENLDFAVLTGVLRIAKESIFSDLNNLKVDSLVHVQYPKAFGFTSDEVAQMAADLGKTDNLAELRDWYDGYRLKGQEIYNPWSVLNYFDRGCQPEPYWVNTSGNAILQEMLQHASEETLQAMQGVLQGQSITAMLREGVIYSEIYANRNALYTMLLTTGYLTCAQSERTDLGTRAQLIIPNREGGAGALPAGQSPYRCTRTAAGTPAGRRGDGAARPRRIPRGTHQHVRCSQGQGIVLPRLRARPDCYPRATVRGTVQPRVRLRPLRHRRIPQAGR